MKHGLAAPFKCSVKTWPVRGAYKHDKMTMGYTCYRQHENLVTTSESEKPTSKII